jgi:hypothetical protein
MDLSLGSKQQVDLCLDLFLVRCYDLLHAHGLFLVRCHDLLRLHLQNP